MIVSRRRSYVFVHIPKTGGTSLASALEQRATKDDILIGDTPKARNRHRRQKGLQARGRLWKHSTLADIDGLVPPEVLQRMFTFTLVRNPWDRFVSYYHWLRDQKFDHPAVSLAKVSSFEEFLLKPATLRSIQAHPARRYMTRADGHEQCRAFIRLEKFEEDAEPLFAHLGFRLTLPHLNGSEREVDHRQYYSTRTRNAVADACAEDIARFDYRFHS